MSGFGKSWMIPIPLLHDLAAADNLRLICPQSARNERLLSECCECAQFYPCFLQAICEKKSKNQLDFNQINWYTKSRFRMAGAFLNLLV